jgi:predicted transcriptional regulator
MSAASEKQRARSCTARSAVGAMQGKVLGFIKSHPGLRIEEINRELGTTTKDLALPMRKLIAGKAIKTEGQRRATKYFAGAAAKGAKKKSTPSKK